MSFHHKAFLLPLLLFCVWYIFPSDMLPLLKFFSENKTAISCVLFGAGLTKLYDTYVVPPRVVIGGDPGSQITYNVEGPIIIERIQAREDSIININGDPIVLPQGPAHGPISRFSHLALGLFLGGASVHLFGKHFYRSG